MSWQTFLIPDREEAAELSRHLREDRGPELARRRAIAGATLVSGGAMALIALFQLGLIRHLPDLPGGLFDADDVDADAAAYRWASAPDGTIGLLSYATTLLLAAAGPADRRPTLRLLLLGKTTVDAVQALVLTRRQWTQERAFCIWCLLATAATLATVPLALPGGIAAIREISRRD